MTPSQAYALAALFGTRWRGLSQSIIDATRLLAELDTPKSEDEL